MKVQCNTAWSLFTLTNIAGYLPPLLQYAVCGDHAFQYKVLQFCLFKVGIGNLMYFS